MTDAALRFADLRDLARLPWFDVHEERLVTADRAVGPVIDMHTHLALSYVRPPRVDLQRSSSETLYYLPACSALDLDVYANRNFAARQLKAMKRDLTIMSLTGKGMRATHTVPNLVRDMGDLGIAHSIVLPIDLRIPSRNAASTLAATRDEERTIAFGSVHPSKRDRVERLEAQVAAGVRGIKMHPAVQAFRPDARGAMQLYAACGRLGVPVLLHCGPVDIETPLGRYFSQVRHYERPIRENPRTQFVLGHAGALQSDEALALQRRYPNVWLETSSISLAQLRAILAEGDVERVVYGTDWPFYHQAIALAKVLVATEGRPELRRKILFDNAARLLRL
jgi:predicted TIM-barrel fold metal-dependent hydrolase